MPNKRRASEIGGPFSRVRGVRGVGLVLLEVVISVENAPKKKGWGLVGWLMLVDVGWLMLVG